MTAEVERKGQDGGDMSGDPLHPAARAWLEFSPHPSLPDHIEVLKEPRPGGKSAVFNIGPVGPDDMEVAAKELRVVAAQIERTMYCDVLPMLSINGPTFLGFAESVEDSKSWLFLEAVTGARFDKLDQLHVELATRWLATLHAETADGSFEADLPRRGPGFYQSRLLKATAGLEEVLSNPAISPAGRQLLQRISATMQPLVEDWAQFAEIYSTVPVALAHGDFKDKNMGFSLVGGRLELLVFDWSEAHWGPMAIDLWAADIAEYQLALRERGLSSDVATIERWKGLGGVLRLISAVAWEIPRLRFEWVERPMRRMAIYERQLQSAIRNSVWD